jgi:hypothetical protein
MDRVNDSTLLRLPIIQVLSRGLGGPSDREAKEVNPSRRFATVFAADMHV